MTTSSLLVNPLERMSLSVRSSNSYLPRFVRGTYIGAKVIYARLAIFFQQVEEFAEAGRAVAEVAAASEGGVVLLHEAEFAVAA